MAPSRIMTPERRDREVAAVHTRRIHTTVQCAHTPAASKTPVPKGNARASPRTSAHVGQLLLHVRKA